jgi:hypothetical protein
VHGALDSIQVRANRVAAQLADSLLLGRGGAPDAVEKRGAHSQRELMIVSCTPLG